MLCAARSIEHEEYARSRNKGASFGNKAPTTIAKREKQMKIQVLFALSSVLAGVLSGAGICTVYAQGGQVREIGSTTPPNSDSTVVHTANVTLHVPIQITEPGNYRLNTNLSNVQSAVISIDSSDVTLDLNGFNIASPGSTAIIARGANIAILNGSIRPGDGAAILLSGSNCRVEGLQISGGRDGILLSSSTNCIVKNNTVQAARTGILCSGCVVSGNNVNTNIGVAIAAADASLVVGNRATGGDIALHADDTTGYAENVLRGGEIDVSGGVQIGENLCVTNKFCAP